MGFLYLDEYYIIFVLPALIFTLVCQWRVNSTFKKYSKMHTSGGLDGARAAYEILRANNLRAVRIEHVQGNLSDHFDPRTNIVRLSDDVYSAQTVAAVGVAAHECGHAAQCAEGYFPMKLRSAIIPITRIGSNLAIPLIILGLIFSFPPLYSIGIICFSLSVVLQLVTLPVEFNASRRALSTIDEMALLDDEQLRAAKKVLRAAAMTYVAALALSVAQLLRLLAIVGRGNSRKR